MTLMALGGPAFSQPKCQTRRAPSTSHSKEECPCTADGKAGCVPTVSHLPTKTSNCLSETVGCGGWGLECLFRSLFLLWVDFCTAAYFTWKAGGGHTGCR